MEYKNKLQNYVVEFHRAFNHPIAANPRPLELQRAVNRSVWTGEEIVEFLQASSSNQMEFDKAYADFMEGMQKAYVKSSHETFDKDAVLRIVGQMDALADLIYFALGSAVEIGIDLERVFDIVQSSNMSKLFKDEDGNRYAKYREDGKVLKSPEFFEPEVKIIKEVMNQISERF